LHGPLEFSAPDWELNEHNVKKCDPMGFLNPIFDARWQEFLVDFQ
jgi:hypothetical protein